MSSSLPTRHLSNIPFDLRSLNGRWIIYILLLVVLFFALFEELRKAIFMSLVIAGAFGCAAYYFMVRCRVMFTLTPTHFQQHFYKGGWVLKWSNIQEIGICQYGEQGWYKPLPWIGIKIKDYQSYVDAICPRISTEILLSQRALLYVGVQQAGDTDRFEDIVLDSTAYTCSEMTKYTGLQAMLANRMNYQRRYHGYDIFISVDDLSCSEEEFVGLARRYLAAAEPEYHDNDTVLS